MSSSDSEETIIDDWSSRTPSPPRYGPLHFYGSECTLEEDEPFFTYPTSILDEDDQATCIDGEEATTVCNTPPPPSILKEEKYPKDFYVSLFPPAPEGYGIDDERWAHDLHLDSYAEETSRSSHQYSNHRSFSYTDEQGYKYSYELKDSVNIDEAATSHASQQQHFIERQRFIFYSIINEPLYATVETLPNNRVIIYGADDSFCEISYNPHEISRVEKDTYEDQSMRWRDKYVPDYSKLRMKKRVIERYVPRYSRLASGKSKWREGIYRCFDRNEEEEKRNVDEGYAKSRRNSLPEQKSALEQKEQDLKTVLREQKHHKQNEEHQLYGMEVDPEDSDIPLLYGVLVENLVAETEPEDVKLAFSDFGAPAIAVQLLHYDPQGISMLVVFDDEFAAYKAVRNLDQVTADGKVLSVQIAKIDQATLKRLAGVYS